MGWQEMECEIEREHESERDGGRQTDTCTHPHTHRPTHKHTHRERDGQMERQRIFEEATMWGKYQLQDPQQLLLGGVDGIIYGKHTDSDPAR